MLKSNAASAALSIVGLIGGPAPASAQEDLAAVAAPAAQRWTFLEDGQQDQDSKRTPDEKRREHDARYERAISECRGLGLQIVLERGATTGEDRLVLFMPEPRDGLASVVSATPLRHLENYSAQARDLPPQLRETNSIPVFPLSIHTSLSDRKFLIRVEDHLVRDTPFVHEYPDAPDSRKEATRDLVSTVRSLIREREELHRAVLAKIVPDREAKPLIQLVPNEDAVSPVRKVDLRAIVRVTNPNRTAEENVVLRLSSDQLDQFARNTLRARGTIEEIIFMRRDLTVTVDRKARTVNGEPLADISQDAQGNSVVRSWVTFQGNNTKADQALSIRPRYAFGLDPVAEPHFQPVVIDLTWLGGEKLPYLVEQPVLFPVTEAGPYRVYGNWQGERLADKITGNLKLAAEGAAAVERAFGFEPGAQLKRLVVVNSDHENGIYQYNNPRTTFLYDEAMIDAVWAATLSRHETLHALDAAADKRLSAGAFEERYNEVLQKSPEFFAAINEGIFLRGEMMPKAGHSADNSAEFFATFVNGILSSSWETRIRDAASAQPERGAFLKEYGATLSALKTSLERSTLIPRDAPIFELITQRAAFVEKLSKQR